MSKFKNIFGKEKVIIGAIHFPPLLGYDDFPGLDVALENAFKDLDSLEQGGVGGIIFENNYDIPHIEFVSPEVTAAMTFLIARLKTKTSLPLGVSVLWNDYKTALSIAKILGLQFIRVPAYVDTVETSYGLMRARAKEVKAYQKKIGAEEVGVFADIHVKHSKIISKHSIRESAQLAITFGADAIIVTGRWTGDSPDICELKEVRSAVGNFPIIIGSGVDRSNVKELFRSATGAIVSTSLKRGNIKEKEVNLKEYDQRIELKKVSDLMSEI